MWPLVRDTAPAAPIASVLAPVVTLPLVSVSVPVTVRFPPASVTPLALFTVTFVTLREGGTSKPVVRPAPSGW